MRALWIRLQANWMRNLLAVLQVAAATAAVSAVLIGVLPALVPSTAEPHLLEVRYGFETGTGGSYAAAFTLDDVLYLQQEADTVEAVTIVDFGFASIFRIGDERYAVRDVAEVTPSYAAVYDVDMLYGGFFTEADMEAEGDVPVVISDRLARTLFQKVNAVGEKLNLRPDNERNMYMGFVGGALDQQAVMAAPGLDLQVVGVFRYREQDPTSFRGEPHLLLPLGAQRRSRMQQVGFFGTAVSATGTAAVVVDAAPVPVRPVVEATYGELLVKPKPGMAAQAEHEIVALLSERVAERNRQMAARVVGMPQDEFEVLVSVPGDSPALRRLRLQSGLIVGSMGLAALVVAGFAIFTTTLANLTERTRAIGLARAIGATRGRILREVVAESVLLSAVGGVIGALTAYPFGRYVVGIWQSLTAGVSWTTVASSGLIGILLAVLIGAVAAVFPAWSVAQLMPAEAFREGRG